MRGVDGRAQRRAARVGIAAVALLAVIAGSIRLTESQGAGGQGLDYARVFGVAHNAGDDPRTARAALAAGADVIEIDVAPVGGALAAADLSPSRRGGRGRRLPSLAVAWAAAAGAEAIELDLKGSSPSFLNAVIGFIEAQRAAPPVLVASREPAALRTFADRLPSVFRFLSVATPDQLRALQRDASLVALLDGVTLRHDLADATTMAWLHEHGLLVLAWTVNSRARVDALVRLGVDAITTDDPAILALLGGHQRGEAALTRRPGRATPVAVAGGPGRRPVADAAVRAGGQAPRAGGADAADGNAAAPLPKPAARGKPPRRYLTYGPNGAAWRLPWQMEKGRGGAP